MTATGWLILGVWIIGLLIWLITRRLSYMFLYFALFSLVSFIYRLSTGYTFSDAFFSAFGLVDIVVLVVGAGLLIEKIKERKSEQS